MEPFKELGPAVSSEASNCFLSKQRPCNEDRNDAASCTTAPLAGNRDSHTFSATRICGNVCPVGGGGLTFSKACCRRLVAPVKMLAPEACQLGGGVERCCRILRAHESREVRGEGADGDGDTPNFSQGRGSIFSLSV